MVLENHSNFSKSTDPEEENDYMAVTTSRLK